uniref:PDZ domain-containing protein n=1 Tax=Caenorhabditis japonica TaxID=281687 RepID=A0A8R1DYY8_CAEJA
MSSGNRQAPMPPPKPRSLSRGQFYHAGGYLTPQDSDTDSGISADCDQGSPRAAAGFHTGGLVNQSQPRRIPDIPPTAYHNSRSQSSSADYLTPNSARKIAGYGTTPRRLPLQPQQQSTPPPTKTKYRVRFADEVDSGASTSSGTSSTHISPRNNPQEMLMNSAACMPATTPYQPSAPSYATQTTTDAKSIGSNNDFALMGRAQQSTSSSARTGTLQRTPNRRLPFDRSVSATPQPQPTYGDQVTTSHQEPPPYSIAMQRIRSTVDQQPQESFRDAYIRKSVNDTLQRRYRQRSSSLPRGNKSYYEGIEDMYSMQPPLPPPASSLVASINQLPGSLDNLHISNVNNMGMRRRKLPTAPLMGSSCQLHLDNSDDLTAFRVLQFQMIRDELNRQPQPPLHHPQQFERQPTLLRRTNLPPQPQQNFNIPHITTTGPPPIMGMGIPVQYDNGEYGVKNCGPQTVRAQLVALDQRGFRRVLVEKMMPGPFGFYIATGVVAGQRAGIFISRVSLPSLSPMLTVGDEIIYVDEEYVKGRSLEYVQSVIAGKTSVTITLVPAVGQPAIC